MFARVVLAPSNGWFFLIVFTLMLAASEAKYLKLSCLSKHGIRTKTSPMFTNNKRATEHSSDSFLWLKDGKPVVMDSGRLLYRRNKSILKIRDPVEEHNGVYTCYSISDGMPGTLMAVYNISDLKPGELRFEMSERQRDTYRLVGKNVKLLCLATGGKGLISYRWYKDGQLLLRKSQGRDLEMFNLTESDSGTYKCVASNRLSSISFTFNLEVEEKKPVVPFIEKGVKNLTVPEGQDVSSHCFELVLAEEKSPVIYFHWLKWTGKLNQRVLDALGEGKRVPDAHRYFNIVNGEKPYTLLQKRHGDYFDKKLTLTNITKDDEGFYTCLVRNKAGYDFVTMYLAIKDCH